MCSIRVWYYLLFCWLLQLRVPERSRRNRSRQPAGAPSYEPELYRGVPANWDNSTSLPFTFVVVGDDLRVTQLNVRGPSRSTANDLYADMAHDEVIETAQAVTFDQIEKVLKNRSIAFSGRKT